MNDNPMHYCPGCSHGVVHKLIAEVIEEMGMEDKTVGISPVGCAVFAYNYLDIDWQEAAHGRAPAVATAVKRLWPDRLVFTYQGDGDLACIGTAETIHALNRGENITIIFINNAIYGMTGGQMAPTTLIGMKTATCPYGRDVTIHGYPLKMTEIAATLEGTAYVTRQAVHTVAAIRKAKKAIRKAFENSMNGKGSNLVEIVSTCNSAPPNITGQLHMGHALDETLQDILIRWKRMSGYSTLWLPGTDHASIATEAKIVEAMRKEGIKKEDIGRDGFLERAWDWKKQYGGRIVEQLKKLGSSCDWTRERFTMDEGCNKAVKEVFIKYYEEGLIYRGERIINWCPKCLTSISDAEVEYEDQAGHFWHLRYPLKDGSGYLELATTRPETLLGDTAVAVNPNDERYQHLIGKTLILPLVHREIPIVADEYVEMDFGTGVVKITPAHDPNDFEVGLRHNLEVINVMTDDAKITDDYPKYAGMDRYEARKAIVEDLKAEGALVEIEDYSHNVGTCYR